MLDHTGLYSQAALYTSTLNVAGKYYSLLCTTFIEHLSQLACKTHFKCMKYDSWLQIKVSINNMKWLLLVLLGSTPTLKHHLHSNTSIISVELNGLEGPFCTISTFYSRYM